ncbi:MAG: hypothetical protein U0V87_09680 [Acidobacteriota bacterium]
MICTQDALSDNDRDASNNTASHTPADLVGFDLVHWIYRGDALSSRPPGPNSTPTSGRPATILRQRYYQHFAATAVAQYSGETNCFDDSGITVSPPQPRPWDRGSITAVR